SKLSFRDQVKLFANSKIIFGAHGAGFTNILFASPDAVLIEVFPNNYYDGNYKLLTHSLGIKSYEIKVDNGTFNEWFTIKKPVLSQIISIIKNHI
ncbi:MAG: glycosyltransferase family 61 protein, partial [Proteobacteria bacterium]|nr:glycosyltransferase family 61 protein [Pseudomonadota bacterium]